MFTIEIIVLSKSIDFISYLEFNVNVIINASDVYLTNMDREHIFFISGANASWVMIEDQL